MEIIKNDKIQKLQTPCFILNENELKNCICEFKTALNKNFENKNIIGYSVKTNSLPYCLKIAKENGCYAEVVSYHEYQLAINIGFTKEHIIYNGPLKSKKTFLDAIQHNAIVNIETWREIYWLNELPKNKIYEIGIRININSSNISQEDAFSENDDSRFGFSYESGDLLKAIKLIQSKKHIKIVGIHSHKEPKTRSLRFYQKVIKYVISIIDSLQIDLKYWDLGGGFFGPMPNKPTFNDYSNSFYKELRNAIFGGYNIIIEPGNALISSSFTYICSVIDIKEHDGNIYITTDGTRNDIDPFFKKSDYFKSFIYTQKETISSQEQIIGGLTCLEYDRLFTLPKNSRTINIGDKIIFDRVGSYTMALTPLFIHYFPIVYLKTNTGEFRIIREEWDTKEFLMKSKY